MTTAAGKRVQIQRKIRATPTEELDMLQVYEQAYVGYESIDTTPESSPHHPKQVLSTAEINDAAWSRLWKPRNFLAKVVEEPVGYLGMMRPRLNITRVGDDGVKIDLDPDSEEDKRLQQQVHSFYERVIRPRQADVALWQGMYGRAFGKLTYDPGTWAHRDIDDELVEWEDEPGLHLVAYPRFEGGIERANTWHDSEDPDRITAAVVYWIEREEMENGELRDVKHAQLLYPDRIEWLVHAGSGWVLDQDRGDPATPGITAHDWGVVPIAECWNNGKPDVHDGLEAQAILNKDIYDQNASAQTVAFPQRYRKGLIPQGGWARNPLTGRTEQVEPLRSGPYIVWDVPEGGDVGQLEADTGTYLFDKYESDLADLATLCRSVAVFKLKGAGQNTSGESKHMDSAQVLKPRLEAKAEGLAAFIRDIFRLAFEMARADANIAALVGIEDYDGLAIEAEFELELDRDKQAEATLDQADRRDKNLSLHSYLIRRGFTESEAKKEIERLKDEREEMMQEAMEAQSAMDPYGTGAKPKPPGSNGAAGAPAAGPKPPVGSDA